VQFAVISDVQGNLPALEAVLGDIRSRFKKIERIVSAGDLVGRGPWPNEVIDLIRQEGIESTRGNYDDAVAFQRMGSGNDFATLAEEDVDRRAIAWTRSRLTPANLEYLSGLPRDLRLFRSGMGVRVERNSGDERTREYQRNYFLRALFGGLARTPASTAKRILIVHGSPRALNEFVREDTAASILSAVTRDVQTDILISGHAGSAYRRDAGGVTFIGVGPVAGMLAQPGVASYAVVDVFQQIEVQFGSVAYDPGAYLAAVRSSGLPAEVATPAH
jgi:predicted phosphodiesterase